MALQDLTPQLRTRLSRMERVVGWFVIFAALLLLLGFGYYVYNTAQNKGWFIKKIDYETSIKSVAGLKVGDPVMLMGMDVGAITRITPNKPSDYYNITVYFQIKAPYYGYLWSDSVAKVAAGNLLVGSRSLEVTKGTAGVPTILETTNKEPVGMLNRQYFLKRKQDLWNQWSNQLDTVSASALELKVLAELNSEAGKTPSQFYTDLTRKSVYWLNPEESPSVTERLESLVGDAEKALPNILNLTNQLVAVLSNTATLESNLNVVAASARPAVSNLAFVTAQLNQPGALGEWLLPTNIDSKLDSVLGSANSTLSSANTNLTVLVDKLGRSLDHLANITSNLNQQIQANTNILSGISRAVVDADDLVQGLKHFWLFRSTFKHEFTNAPPAAPETPLKAPKRSGSY